MIIDFHTHIFPPEIVRERGKYLAADPLFSLFYSDPRAKLATADDLVNLMDEQGIDIAVVQNIAWGTAELCRQTNDYIMEAVSRYPRRLIGFGMVLLDSPALAIAEIERCAQNGLRGIGETRPGAQWLAAPQGIRPMVECLVAHNLIISIHSSEPVGHLYSGKGDITPQALYPLISAYPDLKIVLAHWGGGLPFYSLMPEVRRAMSRVYFDSAASPYLYSPRIYRLAAELAGEDRILFGSDYPLLKPGRLLAEIESQNLTADLKDKILSGNARELLGLQGIAEKKG